MVYDWLKTKEKKDKEFSILNLFETRQKRFNSTMNEFSEGPSGLSLSNVNFSPQIEVKKDEKSVHIKTEIPGKNEKEIHLVPKENYLPIMGENKEEKKNKNEKEYHKEFSYGRFERTSSLPKKSWQIRTKQNKKRG